MNQKELTAINYLAKVRRKERFYFYVKNIFWGIIFAFLVTLTSFLLLKMPHRQPAPIESRVDSLNKAESALQDLQTFIEAQKQSLKNNEETITKQNNEKSQLEAAVQVTRPQAEALVWLVNQQSAAQIAVKMGVSFIVGFFSNVAYGAISDWWKPKRAKQSGAEKTQ